MSAPDRRAMVERSGKDLSVRRQCALVGVARSGIYRPKPVAGGDDLAVMRRIDELHLELPFYGSRRMTFELNKEGRGVNRKRVRRLMRVMGIEALVPRPGTSKAAPGHKIYPYLLRGLKIVEPNHVWAADVTFIPMACGFLYLVVIIDWASRAVLAWRLSNTNDASFCAAALEEALLRFGTPRIFNTDVPRAFPREALPQNITVTTLRHPPPSCTPRASPGRFVCPHLPLASPSVYTHAVPVERHGFSCSATGGLMQGAPATLQGTTFLTPLPAVHAYAGRGSGAVDDPQITS